MIYAVSYDLKKPGQNYDALYEAIKSCGAWWHYLESTWLIDTNLTAESVWQRLSPHVDTNDRVLVIGVTGEHAGWLTQKAWDWIKSRHAMA